MTDNSYAVLDANKNEVERGPSPRNLMLDPRVAPLNEALPLRVRLKSVGVSANGTLLIGAKSGAVYRLELVQTVV